MNHELHESNTEILYPDECYQIQGAIFDVYKNMGTGFLESVYQECLKIEFSLRNIPFSSQKKLDLKYKGNSLKKTYLADFVCFDKIIIEIKAVKELCADHQAQTINYLKATRFKLGLLVNFCSYPKVTIKRLAQ
ncbi:MAG: GxxExxY protein [Desulfamplus sp.]|nr:GxxExxY protein [Desulfamplus sp.]